MIKIFGSALIVILALLLGHQRAVAAAGADCTAIESTLAATQKGAVILPEILISDWQRAVPCLVTAIGNLRPRVVSDRFDDDVQARYMSITAALRSIISRLSAEDQRLSPEEQKQTSRTGVFAFASLFRSVDNLDVIWVLTYGVRNQNQDVRLNSLLILANVIDNRTLCIPLDHLFDPSLSDTDTGKRGRANLLSVVSVVAPWAYLENYKNIQSAETYIRNQKIDGVLFKDTNAILANIDARLQSQSDDSNKSVKMKADMAKSCREYKLNWATKEQISY